MQSLKNALELLDPGRVGSIIGLASIAVGIAAAVITYLITRQRTRFAYSCSGRRLLGLAVNGLPKDITVQYQGHEIPCLTRTLVVFWNAGEKTIPAEDMVSSDPLRLRIPDGRILSATVLKQVRDVCQVQAGYDPLNPTEVAISFEFLDSGDGAAIEVLHTSEKHPAEFLGTIRGIPKGLRDFGRSALQWRYPFSIPFPPRKLQWMVSSAAGLVLVGIGVFYASKFFDISKSQHLSSADSANVELLAGVVVGLGAGFASSSIGVLFVNRRRYPKALHIDELG